MPRKVLLFAALTVLATIDVQGQSTTQPAATVGPFGGPILTTPTAALPTPAPVTGISDAGRAGISNAENNSGNAVPPVSVPVAATATVSSSEAVAGPPEAAVPNATSSATPLEGEHVPDLGPSVYVGDQPVSSANIPMSVAEVAQQYQMKQSVQAEHRTLTNEDVKEILKKKPLINMPQGSQQANPNRN
jgi:hypothetical protein